MSLFIAFGSFAMLLLVDFAGSRLDRLRAQAFSGSPARPWSASARWCHGRTVVAAITMLVVGFVVLFSGVVSSVIASASTPLLLAFILPVTVPDRCRRSQTGSRAGGLRPPSR